MKKPSTAKKPSASPAPASPGVRLATATDIIGRRAVTAVPPRRVPAKWRWHAEVLRRLQARLQREHGDLRNTSAEPMEPHSAEAADSATDEFDHALAMSLLSAEQNALQQVDEALERIRSGGYGLCQKTGARIPAARLKAIPWARYTREVEERLEKRDPVPQRRP